MKRLLVGTLAAALVLPLSAATSTEVDRRADKSSPGGYVFFCSTQQGPLHYVVAAASRVDSDMVAAYGLFREGGEKVVAILDSWRARSVCQGQGTLVVRVDEPAWEDARHLIERWATEEADQGPDNEILNLAERVLDSLHLKRPYRSMLTGPNPAGYFSDVVALHQPR